MDDWRTAAPDPRVAGEVARLLDGLVGDPDRHGQTYAALVVHRDEIVAERYHGAIPRRDGSESAVDATTPLRSWSMAKSVLHALYGVLGRDGLLALDDPAPVAAWQGPDDPRRHITIDDLLAMRDGLDFVEEYAEGRRSDVAEMLFRSGRHDVAAYAIGRPAAHPPGTVFNYSSGTSNVLARIAGDIVARVEGPGPDAFAAFVARELFDPIGMPSARLGFDPAGTWVASSYVYATARDWARFGLLYLHDGVVDGRRLLPEGWVAHGTRPRSIDPTDGTTYGAHWYVVDDGLGTFRASGYLGQWILATPALDLLVVRLGHSDESCNEANTAWRAAIVDALRVTGGRSG